MNTDPIHPQMGDAIAEAAKAGVFRRAERLNPSSAKVWAALAKAHTERAARILALIEGDKP